MPSIAEADIPGEISQKRGLVTSFDRPGTPQEKRAALLQRHIDYGVGFDEEAICRSYGWAVPANPQMFPPSKGVQALDRADERAYRQELLKAQGDAKLKAQADTDQQAQIAALQAKNEHLEAQMNRLLAAVGQAPNDVAVALPPMAVVPPTPKAVVTALDGELMPEANWSRDRTLRWLEAHGYALPPRKGVGMGLIALADFAIEQHKNANKVVVASEAAG